LTLSAIASASSVASVEEGAQFLKTLRHANLNVCLVGKALVTARQVK